MFLRELVSNASDALEKARHVLHAAGKDAGELTVAVTTDPAANTLTVEDTGVGMEREARPPTP